MNSGQLELIHEASRESSAPWCRRISRSLPAVLAGGKGRVASPRSAADLWGIPLPTRPGPELIFRAGPGRRRSPASWCTVRGICSTSEPSTSAGSRPARCSDRLRLRRRRPGRCPRRDRPRHHQRVDVAGSIRGGDPLPWPSWSARGTGAARRVGPLDRRRQGARQRTRRRMKNLVKRFGSRRRVPPRRTWLRDRLPGGRHFRPAGMRRLGVARQAPSQLRA